MKKGWETKRLGEILQLEYGKPLPDSKRNPKGLHPAYGANGEKTRTDEFYYDQRSIIVGRKGSAGEITLTEEKFWPLDVTYFVTFDRKKYDLMFLYHCLETLELTKLAKGVKPGINRNEVYSIPVTVPLLSEQKRIVGVLDKAFAAIAMAKENAEKNLQNARELFDSTLQTIFNKHCDEQKQIRIEDGCEAVIDCVNRTAPKVDEPTAYKMIRTTNVRHGQVSLESVNYVTEEVYHIWTRRQTPQRGDIILTREAPMGEVGMLISDEKVFLGQRLVSYRVNPEMLNNHFLLYALRSEHMQRQIHALASGSTVQHMRVPDTKNLQLPLPSLKEQEATVARLDTLSTNVKQLESLYRQKIAALEELKKSILQKAFSGELTKDAA